MTSTDQLLADIRRIVGEPTRPVVPGGGQVRVPLTMMDSAPAAPRHGEARAFVDAVTSNRLRLLRVARFQDAAQDPDAQVSADIAQQIQEQLATAGANFGSQAASEIAAMVAEVAVNARGVWLQAIKAAMSALTEVQAPEPSKAAPLATADARDRLQAVLDHRRHRLATAYRTASA